MHHDDVHADVVVDDDDDDGGGGDDDDDGGVQQSRRSRSPCYKLAAIEIAVTNYLLPDTLKQ